MTFRRARRLAERMGVEQDAGRIVGAAADAAAQLVQLREAETLGVLDHHQRGVGDVDADLDHCGGDQQLNATCREISHHPRLLLALETAVHQADLQRRQFGTQALEGVDGGLQLQLLGLLDERADPVGLPAFRTGVADAGDDFVASRFRHQLGQHRLSSRRQFVDHRDVEVGVVAHGQGARDRRRRHHELVRIGTLLAQSQSLAHAEAVLLVDDGKAEARKIHRLLDQRVGADGKRRTA